MITKHLPNYKKKIVIWIEALPPKLEEL